MSGLFTVYALLVKPTAFNAYVGCSAGWFTENNDYFLELSTRAFRSPDLHDVARRGDVVDRMSPTHSIAFAETGGTT